MKHFVATSTSLFPLWVILFSIWAFLEPQHWSNLSFLIIPLLSLIMFSMGLTLKVENFFRIFKNFKVLESPEGVVTPAKIVVENLF